MRKDLSDSSRVWIYQAERELSEEEIRYIDEVLQNFCISWTAHDQSLKAGHDILFKRFIVLSVDESHNNASGCSIDKSTRQLKEISQRLGIDLFNRLMMAYLQNDELKTIPFSGIETAKAEGKFDEDTLFFNTGISNLGQLKSEFLIPFKQHWINRTS